MSENVTLPTGAAGATGAMGETGLIGMTGGTGMTGGMENVDGLTCEELLRRLSAAQFAALEMRLLLDTHPYDAAALAAYQQHESLAQRLREEVERLCGPLTPNDEYGDGRWQWVNAPWPWDLPKEGE